MQSSRGPKTLTSSTFLLSVYPSLNSGSMYVNHPSPTQSVHWISFSAVLHRACDWFTGSFPLKLEWHTMQLCRHIQADHLTVQCCAGPPWPGGGWVSWGGGGLVPRCQRGPHWDLLKVAMSSWLCQHLLRIASRLAWERPVRVAWPWIDKNHGCIFTS